MSVTPFQIKPKIVCHVLFTYFGWFWLSNLFLLFGFAVKMFGNIFSVVFSVLNLVFGLFYFSKFTYLNGNLDGSVIWYVSEYETNDIFTFKFLFFLIFVWGL